MRFSLLGIRFSVSYFAVAFFCLAVIVSRDYRVLFCLLASVIHESGHIAVMRFFGSRVRSVTVYCSQILIRADNRELTVRQLTLIAFSGAALNLAVCAVGLIFCGFSGRGALFDFCMCSLCIGVFNLLPINGLDGADILSLTVLSRFSAAAAAVVSNMLTAIVLLPVFAAGFYVLLRSGYNYSLLFIALYLVFVILSKEIDDNVFKGSRKNTSEGSETRKIYRRRA